MKILDRVNLVSRIVKDDHDHEEGKIGVNLRDAAIKAIRGGIDSPDWPDYMTIFADNEEQLKRLSGKEDSNTFPWANQMSAYLVSSGMCGGLTPGRLSEFLDERIDQGVSNIPNGKIKRSVEYQDPVEPPNNAPSDNQPA